MACVIIQYQKSWGKQAGALLVEHLATLRFNEVTLPGNPGHSFLMITEPAPLRSRAFELLDMDQGDLFPVRIQVEFTNTPIIVDQCAVLLNEVRSNFSESVLIPINSDTCSGEFGIRSIRTWLSTA